MSVSVEQFKLAYPEFKTAPDALVQLHLDHATTRTGQRTWGTFYEIGIMLKTADSLALSPEGRALRLVSDDGKSIYYAELRRLRTFISAGANRVVGY